jgi:hypothetical protein
MSTFSRRITAGSDDGDNLTDYGWYGSSNYVLLGRHNFELTDPLSYNGAFRFTNVTIPSGSVINSVYITFTADDGNLSGNDADVQFKVRCIDEDNTATFTSNPYTRSKTTAQYEWDPTIPDTDNYTVTSSNLKDIVQEVIDRPGWVSGNALGFLFEDRATPGYNVASIYSYEGSSSKCALVEIDYTPPATTTSTSTSTSSSTTSSTSSSSTTTGIYSNRQDENKIYFKASLEGNNAISDPVRDHLALFLESRSTDDILIKEKTRGSATITTSTTTPYEITHNLGYIPFFVVYVYDKNLRADADIEGNKWRMIPNFVSAYLASAFYCYSDNYKVYIWNLDGTDGVSSTTFKWYIFYDDVVGASGLSVVESSEVIKVSRSGKNVLSSKDPNDFIFHSDLNTFKIIKEGNSTITYTVDGYYNFVHNADISGVSSSLLFVKFPDGYTKLIQSMGFMSSEDDNFYIRDYYITNSDIYVYIQRESGEDTTLNIKYYIFETPLE